MLPRSSAACPADPGPPRLRSAPAGGLAPFLILPQLQGQDHHFKSYLLNRINALLGTAGSAIGEEMGLAQFVARGCEYSAGQAASPPPPPGTCSSLGLQPLGIVTQHRQGLHQRSSASIGQAENFSQLKYGIFHKWEQLCKVMLVALLL